MTFNDREISTQDGRLVALYALKWGNTYWRYTSADRPITRDELVGGVAVAVTYQPAAVSDEGVVQGGSAQNDFTLDGPYDLPIVGLFRGTPPGLPITLTVRRMHYEDGQPEAPIYWKGLVTNVKTQGLARAQVIGKPLSATFDRTGLRLCWTKECPHFLYDMDCKVDPEAYRVNRVISALGGTVFQVGAAIPYPDRWFRGGYVEWIVNTDGTKERRMIEDQVGNEFTVFGLTDGMKVGLAVALYPGCDRTPGTCTGKFNNLPNHGGFEFMPGETPFGTQIF